jgi:hypothetical protein
MTTTPLQRERQAMVLCFDGRERTLVGVKLDIYNFFRLFFKIYIFYFLKIIFDTRTSK